MITTPTKSVKYNSENMKFFHNLSYFTLEINYFPVLLSVRALITKQPKWNKRKVVSGSRVTLPENFACKPGLSFNPLARVTLAVGLPYLLVNRALHFKNCVAKICSRISALSRVIRQENNHFKIKPSYS